MDTSLAAFTGTTPYTLPANQGAQSQQATMAPGRGAVHICFILACQMISSGLQAVSRNNKKIRKTELLQFTVLLSTKSNTLYSTTRITAQSVMKVSHTVLGSPYVLFAVGDASWMRIEWGTDTK